MRYLIGLLLFSWSLLATAEAVKIPDYTQPVIDQTGTLTTAQIQGLTAKLVALEQEKGAQVAVLIIPDTGDETIETFSMRVVEKWKLGRENVDDGVLLLIAKESRKLRIEVGYGLEGALSDVIASRIIREHITPEFKKGNYASGVDAGIHQIIRVIKGEDLAPAKASDELSPSQLKLLVGLVLALVAARFAGKRLGDAGKGRWNVMPSAIASVITAGIHFLIYSEVIYSLACAAMTFASAMLLIYVGLGSRATPNTGNDRDRSDSHRSRSSSSSSRSGGSFGGGCSSGDW